MPPDTLQLLKACAVAFFGVFGFCYLSLLVHRSSKKDPMMAAGGGLALILPMGQFVILLLSLSMLGSIHFAGIALLVLSYACAVGAVILIGRKYPGN